MALGDPYATVAEIKARMGITNSDSDDRLEEALNAASRRVEQHCDRQFNNTDTASARVYYPATNGVVWVDDFHTTTGLLVKTDSGNDGTYETTWASTDYQLEPLNGLVGSESGWPYSRIIAVGNQAFSPDRTARGSVQVTAKWGWNAVPAPVKEATLILAETLFKLKDAPFGVSGFDQWGVVRVRENPYVTYLLEKYERHLTLVG